MLLLAGWVPTLGWTALVWAGDRHNREPFWLLGVGFLVGAFVVTTIAGIFNVTAVIVGFGEVGTAVLVAPVVEEVLKFGAVLVMLFGLGRMKEPVDAMVYAATVGFGFAAVENVYYFGEVSQFGGDALLGTIVVRTFGSAVLHGVASGLAGAAVGRAARDNRGWAGPAAGGVAAAIALHGTWNLSVSFGPAGLLVAGASLLGCLVVFVTQFRSLVAASPHALAHLPAPVAGALHLPAPDPASRMPTGHRTDLPPPVVPGFLPTATVPAPDMSFRPPAPHTKPPPQQQWAPPQQGWAPPPREQPPQPGPFGPPPNPADRTV